MTQFYLSEDWEEKNELFWKFIVQKIVLPEYQWQSVTYVQINKLIDTHRSLL